MRGDLKENIKDALGKIREVTDMKPKIGIVLGTGLGELAKQIETISEISYDEIPHFPISTVESHHGKLIFGKLGGKEVVAMQGRFHYYEGYDMQQIVFPIRVMKFLGAETLIVSNACGTMNPQFQRGGIMIIADHINMLGQNPLIGPNDEELGPRFPDMSEPYSKRLIELMEKVALEEKIKVVKGVYVAMTGPCLETRAEYRFLRLIGADVVGMSTVPECIAARHMGMEVAGLSIMTDECYPDSLKACDLSDILEAAAKAEPNLAVLVKKFVEKL